MLDEDCEWRPIYCRDTFTVTEGIVSIAYPSRLSEESYAEVVEWMEIEMRKLKRMRSSGPVIKAVIAKDHPVAAEK